MSTRILALDTATEACSVALWNDGEIHSLFEVCPREHTQRVLPMVQQLLAEHGITLNQLDALAFARGPGSFTGVRIGIGIAQGLALGAGLPMLGVSTLATLAQGAHRLTGANRVLAAIDARMGEVYWASYERDQQGHWQGEASEAVLAPVQVQALTASLSGDWATAGTGWQTYPDLLGNPAVILNHTDVQLPQAQDMLPMACQLWSSGGAVNVEQAEPRYLRNNVAWKKLPGRE
ncbi:MULTISPECIES: tRNA (adenosine(37)-N6)-threonylcarbamoyltransferase complex dimerization subunit type 1 TsaB [Dickeya]|uniref:tRNA (adenosine(37)-N6)-threonylcarbamoyltransferase complex dimerization subunit type 1 TsaB n=1 Tax=Dickeya TaxID=204037 RepID=UPI0003A11B95|nr:MULTISPECIES: tRNA (adenosine(37)-N6)-threonylcarbamoyltransferase complex dimerization subunit type 1 TsaB [Dickeya]MBP2850179.1 tRNA (adenosine(37)-N6)-threonylcarbamoyltransferase complex dimerization subunit type 1 TsaB [Dickeya oryzae]